MMGNTEDVLLCTAVLQMKREIHSSDTFTGSNRLGGVSGRKWQFVRNDPKWIFRFAIKPIFISSPDWRAIFRILCPLLWKLRKVLPTKLQRPETNSYWEKVDPFLMAASSTTYRKLFCKLGMGPSTVLYSVREVSSSMRMSSAKSLYDWHWGPYCENNQRSSVYFWVAVLYWSIRWLTCSVTTMSRITIVQIPLL